MSFKMRADESMTRAIRTRARAQLEKATDTLGDPRRPFSDRVHDMRTSIKKVRALIALVRSSSPGKARRAERRLRKLAATTSALRDAQVVLDTIDAVSPAQVGGAKRHALPGVRNRLSARLRAVERTFETERQLDSLTAALLHERRRVSGWVPPRGGRWDKLWRGPCVGLSKSYRRARRTMTRAYYEQTPDAFHDWRKAVKTHRYQLQFLQLVWPRDVTTELAELERLGELLGSEHDLTVLSEALATDAAVPANQGGDDIERKRLSLLLEQRRRELREEARPLGERLFHQRARLFRRRLQDSLHASRPSRVDEPAEGPPDDDLTTAPRHATATRRGTLDLV